MQGHSITPYSSPEFGIIRTIEIDGEPWFVAKDICNALNLSNTAMALKGLDEDEKNISKVYTLGGKQNLWTVTEPGLYKLINRSNKPEAKAFQRWVTHEVIPSIRKHGAYITPQAAEDLLANPDALLTIVQNWQRDRKSLEESQAANEALKAENEEMKPKALFADAVATSKKSILVGEMAKILKQNGVPNMGQNRFFKWLRENGYLMKRGGNRNMPTQRAMEMGLFEVKETSIVHTDGHTTVNITPKITGKGQQHFVSKFLGEVA